MASRREFETRFVIDYSAAILPLTKHHCISICTCRARSGMVDSGKLNETSILQVMTNSHDAFVN